VTLPSLTKTTVFFNNYVDIANWINRLKSIEEEVWNPAFNNYSYANPSSSKGLLKETVQISILAKDVERLVQDVLGVNAPSFIVDKFTLLAQEKSVERMITWIDFKSIISQVITLLEFERVKRSEIPTLVKLMKEPSIIDKDMGPLGEISTVYRDTTFASTTTKKSSAFPRTYPHTKADMFLSTVPMDPTTSALSAGTAKGTCHLPGYTGHIPRNKRNDRKVAHSFALNPRPTYNNLLLSHQQVGCISGYTGKCVYIAGRVFIS
jgi:hypothetical protein